MSRGLDSKFAKNSLWNFVSILANVAVATLLSPYILKTLGDQRFGIWALAFTLLDYLWWFDFGFSSAVATLCARYSASGARARINEVVNTAGLYFSLIGAVIWILTLTCHDAAIGLFKIPAEYRSEFSKLLLLTGLTSGVSVLTQVFVAGLDGLQRFDLTGRVSMGVVITRSSSYAILLKLGFGLTALGWAFLTCQIAGCILHYLNFRRAFPEYRMSLKFVRLAVLKEIARYGIHAFVATVSNLCLNQSPALLIGHFLTPQFVSYFALPARLMQNGVDVVSKVANVTRSRAAELNTGQEVSELIDLAVHINRYCFMLFMPAALFLIGYGGPFIRLWLGHGFGDHTAPLLPWLVTANALALAGQFNSGAILFGLGRHQRYARTLAVEGALVVAGLFFIIPRAGILGAAMFLSVLMVAFRGLWTAHIVTSCLDHGFFDYIVRIYARPLAAAIPSVAFLLACKHLGIRGANWGELAAIGATVSILYLCAALGTCLAPQHRIAVRDAFPVLSPVLRFDQA